MKIKLIALLGLGGVLVAGTAGAQLLRSQYDEPAYEVVQSDEKFEIRTYKSRIVAETTVSEANWRKSTSVGFGRLAGFIFGGNKDGDGESSKIAMTTPVESSPTNDGSHIVVFTMPPEYRIADLPKPDDSRVVIREAPAATVATLRFSGVAARKDIAGLSQSLNDWIADAGYITTSPIKIAQYDPPWVIGFLRRNELMVEVKRAEP